MTRERKTIPNFLWKYRKLMGFSQSEVARKLKLKSTNRLSRWEAGLSMPSSENLINLCILYKTFPDRLYHDLYRQRQAELFPDEKNILFPDDGKIRKKRAKQRNSGNDP